MLPRLCTLYFLACRWHEPRKLSRYSDCLLAWRPILHFWQRIFVFATASRPARDPANLLPDGVPGMLSSVVERPERKSHRSHPCSTEVKSAWSYIFTSSYSFVEWCYVIHRATLPLLLPVQNTGMSAIQFEMLNVFVVILIYIYSPFTDRVERNWHFPAAGRNCKTKKKINSFECFLWSDTLPVSGNFVALGGESCSYCREPGSDSCFQLYQ
jgi:hypothetical protein